MNAAELKKNAKDVLESFKQAWEEYVLATECHAEKLRRLEDVYENRRLVVRDERMPAASCATANANVAESEGLVSMAESVVMRKRARLYELIEDLVR